MYVLTPQFIIVLVHDFIAKVNAPDFDGVRAIDILQRSYTLNYGSKREGSSTAGTEDQYFPVFRLDFISIIGQPLRPICRDSHFFDNITISFRQWQASYSAKHVEGIIFDITVLPRRCISFIMVPRNQPRRTNKRAFEPSLSQQDSKRAKLKETSEESSASIIFQTAPTHPLTDEPAVLSTLSNVSNSDMSVVSGLCHPLEKLQLNDTLKIASATREEDYELTRRADLSVPRNSLVYKAHYSKIPGRLVVAKIWRSKLDFTIDSASALKVSSVGRYWLNEVKNHFEIGLHVSQDLDYIQSYKANSTIARYCSLLCR